MGSDDDDHRHSRPRVSHRVTLAAVSSLFAVTLLVILLFLYAKYRQNRRLQRRRVGFVSRLITAQPAAPEHKTALGGLDPAVVSALPEFVYKPAGDAAAVECSVCLAAAADGAKLRLLPNCGHTFHVECVDVWLASHTTCPLCRAEVEPVPAAEPTAPPVDEMSLLHGETAEGKPSGSGSRRLSSFRRMLSRERLSSMRSLDGSCGGDQISSVSSVGASQRHDLERQ